MTCLIKTESDVLSFVYKTEYINEYVSKLDEND